MPEPVPGHTTVTVPTRGDVQVTVRELSGSGELWLRMLRAEIRNGSWAALLDRHRAILPVMADLRDIDTGLAYAPFEDWTDSGGTNRAGLLRCTGMSEASLHRGISDFCTDPVSLIPDAPAWARAAAGLLARRAPRLYVVYPGRVFAGRRPAQETASVGGRLSRVRPEEFSPAPVRPSPAPVREKSHGCESSGVAHRETRARRREESEGQSPVDESQRLRGFTEAVRLMTSGPGVATHRGFKHGDAASILAETDAKIGDVRAAIANANDMLRRGKLHSTWTGYVRTQLINGVTLFKHIADEQDNANRVIERLRRCAELFGDEDTCAALTEWVERAGHKRLAALMGELEWKKDDTRFWGLVITRAMHARNNAPQTK